MLRRLGNSLSEVAPTWTRRNSKKGKCYVGNKTDHRSSEDNAVGKGTWRQTGGGEGNRKRKRPRNPQNRFSRLHRRRHAAGNHLGAVFRKVRERTSRVSL